MASPTTRYRTVLPWALFAVLLALGCGDQAEFLETHYPDGSRKARREVRLDEDGVPINHGRYIGWHPNGNPEVEGTYADGKREGRFTFRHPNGAKSREGTFAGGMPEGLWVSWHPNGAKM
ncbi:MAG: hypothetical protein EHM19_13260, partial [Candidatus Latescibacterota bacterium]